MPAESFNVGGVTVYPREDGRVGVILPSGQEAVMEAHEALTLGEQIESAAREAEGDRPDDYGYVCFRSDMPS